MLTLPYLLVMRVLMKLWVVGMGGQERVEEGYGGGGGDEVP